MSEAISSPRRRQMAGAFVAVWVALSGGVATADDFLPMLTAGDANRRCYAAEAPGDLVFARLETAELPKAGAPVSPLLLSLGRYTIDKASGDTAVIYGLSAKSASGPFTLLSGGGCGTGDTGSAASCAGDCIGGHFDVELSADGKRATLRPDSGALTFVAVEGSAAGSCSMQGGKIAGYVVFSSGHAPTMSFVETDPAACLPMVEPLDLTSIK